MAMPTKPGVIFTAEIEYTNDRAQVKKHKPFGGGPKLNDRVRISGPPETYLDFKKTGWPFEEPWPKEPVRVPAGPYTLKTLKKYHVDCGKLVNKQFEAAKGGLTIPTDL